MTDTRDNDRKTDGSRPAGGTLTIKRPAAMEQSRVKQNFAHGRTKTVVVETKRKRIGDDKPAGSHAPAPEAKSATFVAQPKVAQQTPERPKPAPARPGVVLRTLTAEEKEARDRALAGARVREAEDRKRQEEDARRRGEQEERDRKDREAAAKRKAEDDARHRVEEEGKRKAEEAAKKLAPKTTVPTSRDMGDDDEGARPRVSRPAGGAGAGAIKRTVNVPTPTSAGAG
jgi:translation initiation factor IF-2